MRRSLTEAPTNVRRLMRREQCVHAVEQLDTGAYGYLVSRTALLHPKGETFDVSMGLRGLFQALTKIAAQPEKDFGELVRQRRRKRGLPVAPAGKVLPFLPVGPPDVPTQRAAADSAAETVLHEDAPGEELLSARLRLAERRMAEVLVALEEAERQQMHPRLATERERAHEQALAVYRALRSFPSDTSL